VVELRKPRQKRSEREDVPDQDESRTLGAHRDADESVTKRQKDLAIVVHSQEDTEEGTKVVLQPGTPVALGISSTGVAFVRTKILETDVLVTVVANPKGLHSGNQPLIFLCPDGVLEESASIPIVLVGHVLVRLDRGFVVKDDLLFNGDRVIGEVLTKEVHPPGFVCARVHGLADAILEGYLPRRYVEFLTRDVKVLVDMAVIACELGARESVKQYVSMLGESNLSTYELEGHLAMLMVEAFKFGFNEIALDLINAGADFDQLSSVDSNELRENGEAVRLLENMGCDCFDDVLKDIGCNSFDDEGDLEKMGCDNFYDETESDSD
jgi:hypothetical protein